MTALRHVVIAYEDEQAASDRLVEFGYRPDIAAEIAVYLAQSTDLPGFMPEISAALAAEGLSVAFVELGELPQALARPGFDASASLLWNVTDGIRFYRGSTVPALSRLLGIPRFGAPATAQHLCQDKFASLALVRAAGVPCPATWLLEGRDTLGSIGPTRPDGPFFVKPNTLGAKIGIWPDSLCTTLDEARDRAARIWDRYRDRAVIQPFIPGDDVRVSFLDIGGSLAQQLGIFRLLRDPNSEAAGFSTMKDNESLSGLVEQAAFTPTMENLREIPDFGDAVSAIERHVGALARLLGLADIFSCDLRLTPTSQPVFFEFEVCPAVTIYDFAAYLRGVHGLSLGQALARSFRLAHARAGGMGEA